MLIDSEQVSHDKPRGGSKFKAPSTKDLKGKASKVFGWFKP